MAKFLSKLTSIGNINILEVGTKEADWSDDGNILPATTYCDIVNYVACHPSPYTLKDLKFYKDLDAYKRFLQGRVREVAGHEAGEDRVLVRGRVRDEEKPRDADPRPLIVAQKDGVIINSHCKCTADLEKMCTHRLSLLFWLEAKVRIRDHGTVPRMPASMDESQYCRRICEMDFSSEISESQLEDDDDGDYFDDDYYDDDHHHHHGDDDGDDDNDEDDDDDDEEDYEDDDEDDNISPQTEEEKRYNLFKALHKSFPDAAVFQMLSMSYKPEESKENLEEEPSDSDGENGLGSAFDETYDIASSSEFSGHDSSTTHISNLTPKRLKKMDHSDNKKT